MKHSTVPEIALEAKKELDMENYWNDTSDNIKVISEQNIDNMTEGRSTLNDNEGEREKLKLHLLPVVEKFEEQISPNLTYDIFMFPKAVDLEKDCVIEKSDVLFQDIDINGNTTKNDLEKRFATGEAESSLAISQR